MTTSTGTWGVRSLMSQTIACLPVEDFRHHKLTTINLGQVPM